MCKYCPVWALQLNLLEVTTQKYIVIQNRLLAQYERLIHVSCLVTTNADNVLLNLQVV